ncbi:MAG: hypothetical protein A3A82_00890 [Candidatus Pacebacteria bacterium RIFCSPLOWO2_01_FULL_47_12]|nr:MAG: hypothetical protein A3J60_03340 [Candidatus Pacebacteria bacterium RIFCSPHIGHO2_02_FULL_46_9]OGJ38002.1 MAG: hypothetical protein A3A82_00890 [Candidatus Pacebacteria bacterium RIFCSPLOWO2_01_FULL_47_12]
MRSVLLDTSAYSYLLYKHKSLQGEVEKAGTVYFSPIVVGEILSGFKKGTLVQKNMSVLQQFLSDIATSCDVTSDTAEIYSDIYTKLSKQGTPIPINDVWIAAQCIEFGAELLTFDSHFRHISDLRVWFGEPE